jgi:hypothetical protein
VREKVDLTGILEIRDDAHGYPPCHPAMMTALPLHAWWNRSSAG